MNKRIVVCIETLEPYKPLAFLLCSLVLCTGFLVGCGNDGGSGSSVNPAEGSNWDEMVWDQGQWG